MIDKLTSENDSNNTEDSANSSELNETSRGTGKKKLVDWDVSHKNNKEDKSQQVSNKPIEKADVSQDDKDNIKETNVKNPQPEQSTYEPEKDSPSDSEEKSVDENSPGKIKSKNEEKVSVESSKANQKITDESAERNNKIDENNKQNTSNDKNDKTKKVLEEDATNEVDSDNVGDQTDGSEKKDFAWDSGSTSFLDEEQVYMDVQQKILWMKQSCNTMIEKNISSNEMQEAISTFDEIIKTMNSPLINDEDEINAEEEEELL